MRSDVVVLLLAAFVAAAAPRPALDSVWVSADVGSDTSDCGVPSRPCRSFAFVVDHGLVSDGGTVSVRGSSRPYAGPAAPITVSLRVVGVDSGSPPRGAVFDGNSSRPILLTTRSLVLEGLTFTRGLADRGAALSA